MSSRSKRQSFTTDDLMRRQEVGPRKRQKRIGGEDEDSFRGSDGPASAEDSQSGESSELDEGEDYEGSPPEVPVPNTEEDDTILSRFSFKSRQDTVAKETTVPPHASSPPLTFSEMGVSSSLVSAMNKMSIRTPTEIQVACIPPLLDGMYFTYSVPRPQR
jgi:ATP-dependent RNA helicase DDX49/DBP8